MFRFSMKELGLRLGILACVAVMAGTPMALPQRRGLIRDNTPPVDPGILPPVNSSPTMSHKQRQEFLKAKLDKMRQDAAEMAELASSIQEDLERVTENELPLKVVEKAERVEKLAKQIKNTAKGR